MSTSSDKLLFKQTWQLNTSFDLAVHYTMKIHTLGFLLLPLLISATGCSSSNGAAANDVLLFSTDYGLGIINGATNGPDNHAADVDDAYAVTLALQGNLDIQGIVTTFGNDKAQPSHESARRGLRALGLEQNIIQVGAEGFLDALPVQRY